MKDKSTQPLSVTRKRALAIASTKGGVNKTGLAANLSYTAAQLGLRVLVIDFDGTGGVTSFMGAYAPDDAPGILEVLEREAPLLEAIYAVEDWTPDPSTPWALGGAVVPGGSVAILPARETKDTKTSIPEYLSQNGSGAQSVVANQLKDERILEHFDLVIIDTPGVDTPSVVSAVFRAAEHVVFPLYPEFFALESLDSIDTRLDAWYEDDGLSLNYIGGIPTSVPSRLGKSSTEREVLRLETAWLEDASGGSVKALAPGIEYRKAVSRAAMASRPVACMTSSKRDREAIGTIPAGLTRTMLTILASMRPVEGDEESQQRVDYPVEKLTKEVLKQDMPDHWRAIIEGPSHYSSDFYENPSAFNPTGESNEIEKGEV